MAACAHHPAHPHQHAPGCGHPAVRHDGHRDHLHDGHLHHGHGDHVDDHVLTAGERNPTACSSGHACPVHTGSHTHGAACGHAAVPHAGHVDYWVGGHLHNAHSGHCDDHGPFA